MFSRKFWDFLKEKTGIETKQSSPKKGACVYFKKKTEAETEPKTVFPTSSEANATADCYNELYVYADNSKSVNFETETSQQLRISKTQPIQASNIKNASKYTYKALDNPTTRNSGTFVLNEMVSKSKASVDTEHGFSKTATSTLQASAESSFIRCSDKTEIKEMLKSSIKESPQLYSSKAPVKTGITQEAKPAYKGLRHQSSINTPEEENKKTSKSSLKVSKHSSSAKISPEIAFKEESKSILKVSDPRKTLTKNQPKTTKKMTSKSSFQVSTQLTSDKAIIEAEIIKALKSTKKSLRQLNPSKNKIIAKTSTSLSDASVDVGFVQNPSEICINKPKEPKIETTLTPPKSSEFKLQQTSKPEDKIPLKSSSLEFLDEVLSPLGSTADTKLTSISDHINKTKLPSSAFISNLNSTTEIEASTDVQAMTMFEICTQKTNKPKIKTDSTSPKPDSNVSSQPCSTGSSCVVLTPLLTGNEKLTPDCTYEKKSLSSTPEPKPDRESKSPSSESILFLQSSEEDAGSCESKPNMDKSFSNLVIIETTDASSENTRVSESIMPPEQVSINKVNKLSTSTAEFDQKPAKSNPLVTEVLPQVDREFYVDAKEAKDQISDGINKKKLPSDALTPNLDFKSQIETATSAGSVVTMSEICTEKANNTKTITDSKLPKLESDVSSQASSTELSCVELSPLSSENETSTSNSDQIDEKKSLSYFSELKSDTESKSFSSESILNVQSSEEVGICELKANVDKSHCNPFIFKNIDASSGLIFDLKSMMLPQLASIYKTSKQQNKQSLSTAELDQKTTNSDPLVTVPSKDRELYVETKHDEQLPDKHFGNKLEYYVKLNGRPVTHRLAMSSQSPSGTSSSRSGDIIIRLRQYLAHNQRNVTDLEMQVKSKSRRKRGRRKPRKSKKAKESTSQSSDVDPKTIVDLETIVERSNLRPEAPPHIPVKSPPISQIQSKKQTALQNGPSSVANENGPSSVANENGPSSVANDPSNFHRPQPTAVNGAAVGNSSNNNVTMAFPTPLKTISSANTSFSTTAAKSPLNMTGEVNGTCRSCGHVLKMKLGASQGPVLGSTARILTKISRTCHACKKTVDSESAQTFALPPRYPHIDPVFKLTDVPQSTSAQYQQYMQPQSQPVNFYAATGLPMNSSAWYY